MIGYFQPKETTMRHLVFAIIASIIGAIISQLLSGCSEVGEYSASKCDEICDLEFDAGEQSILPHTNDVENKFSMCMEDLGDCRTDAVYDGMDIDYLQAKVDKLEHDIVELEAARKFLMLHYCEVEND